MTSQSSYTEPRRAGFLPLLLNTIKRRWTTALLIAIIMFFVLPVPLLMIFSEALRHDQALFDIARQWGEVIRFPLVPIVSVLAVVIACVMQRYLHNKVSIDFFHSLPISRTRLLASQLCSGYILLMIPTLIMFLAAMLIIAVNGAMSGELMRLALIALFESVIYSLLFYSIASLVGVVTGVTAVHLILTAVAIFIVPLIYVFVVLFAQIFVEHMWLEYYLEMKVLVNLSPVLRFCCVADNLNLIEVMLFLIFTVIFFALTFFVCKRFKSERAGTSVIFAPLGEVIKYLLVFPMTLAGGLLFNAIMNNGIWMLFGMLCGGILTFMLANTILNKSSKAMFRGLKVLVGYAVVFVAVLLIAVSNAARTNKAINGSLSKVELILDDNTTLISFTDKEVIEAARKLYNERTEYSSGRDFYELYGDQLYGEDYDMYYLDDCYQRLDMKVVFHPTVGIPTAKDISIYNKNELADAVKTILDSEEFKTQYTERLASVDNRSNLRRMTSIYSMSFEEDRCYYNDINVWSYENDSLRPEFKALPSALITDAEKVGFDFFNQTTFGFINLRVPSEDDRNYIDSSHSYLYIPISLMTDNTLEVFHKAGLSNVSPEDFIEAFAGTITEVKVYDRETGETMTFDKLSDKTELLGSVALLGGQTYDSICQLTLIEPRYFVTYTQEYSSEELIPAEDVVFDSETGNYVLAETGEIIDGGNVTGTHTREFSTFFRLGSVPSLVEG